MTIPFVIDNQQHKMADVLNEFHCTIQESISALYKDPKSTRQESEGRICNGDPYSELT